MAIPTGRPLSRSRVVGDARTCVSRDAVSVASLAVVALVTAVDRRARALDPGAEPGRSLHLRRAAGRGRLGARVRRRRLGREHARLQLLLPRAGAHVHARRLAELARAAVFVVTAVVVSELAARSRRRAREASLLAEIATSLLEHGTREQRSSSGSRPRRRGRSRSSEREIALGRASRADGYDAAGRRAARSGRSCSRAATRRRERAAAAAAGARLAARRGDRPRAARARGARGRGAAPRAT